MLVLSRCRLAVKVPSALFLQMELNIYKILHLLAFLHDFIPYQISMFHDILKYNFRKSAYKFAITKFGNPLPTSQTHLLWVHTLESTHIFHLLYFATNVPGFVLVLNSNYVHTYAT